MIDIKIKHGWLYYIKLLLAEYEYFRPDHKGYWTYNDL